MQEIKQKVYSIRQQQAARELKGMFEKDEMVAICAGLHFL